MTRPGLRWRLSPVDERHHIYPEDQMGDVIRALCGQGVSPEDLPQGSTDVADNPERPCIVCMIDHGTDLSTRGDHRWR